MVQKQCRYAVNNREQSQSQLTSAKNMTRHPGRPRLGVVNIHRNLINLPDTRVISAQYSYREKRRFSWYVILWRRREQFYYHTTVVFGILYLLDLKYTK